MERRHLTFFLAVVEAGSISEAARQLHLSQPSVSGAVKELEAELRTPLFVRGRQLTLTPAGRAMVGPARRTLRSFDAVKDAVADLEQLVSGTLDLAVAPTFAVDPAVALLARFHQQYPGIRLRVREASAGVDGFDLLRRADAELLVHGHAGPFPKHHSVRLPLMPMLAVLPPNTDDVPDDAISLEELLRRRVILNMAPDSPAGLAFAAGIAARDLPPLDVAVETAHPDAVIPLILAGVGCALLPESAARAAAQLGATIRPLGFTVRRSCSLFFRRGTLSPAAQAFVDVARELSRPRD